MKYDARSEQTLMTELWDPNLADHPELFVRFVYPWGKPGGPLERFKGPRTWQDDILKEIGEHVRGQRRLESLDLPGTLRKMATASGRGIGKSALVGMIAHWHMSTRLNSTTVVSANGEPQLRTATFPEIKKWITMSLNSHWFELNATSINPAPWFKSLIESQTKKDASYYFIQAKLWVEENPDAFVGLHSQDGMLLIFDEASGIPAPIWSVSEGFFTDVKNPCRLWLAFSNPRRNSGVFHKIFNEPGKDGETAGLPDWSRRQIDSRTVEDTDRALFERIINSAEGGIDSDTARVEVLGQFPRQGDRQFIPSGVAREAQNRKLEADPGAALVMGVDVARFGDDSNVVRFRQGRDARSIPPVRWKGTDFVQTADRVAWLMDKFNPDAVFIDQGLGSAVVDILKAKGYRTTEVAFGSSAENPEYANKRTEMYARARDWLPGGMIDECPLLFGDLTSVEYDFVGAAKDKIGLERKDNLKTRIGRSPDDGDAFVLTFAGTVARRDLRLAKGAVRGRTARDVDYSVFGG